MTDNIKPESTSFKDYASGEEVRWCPGCGDYAILKTLQKTLADQGVSRENTVFVSGIGCAARFPYYMNTYGFHTIHGRAPAIATGLKIMRPELSVWVVTGDGDALSIGGNHLIHSLRRNLDIKILLFNNRIYGLTKGQYSPTSEVGKVASTTPRGAIDYPLSPLKIALAAGATFVARALDVDSGGLQAVVSAAMAHKGSAIIEIYQNCHIYNDGAFANLSDKQQRADHGIWLRAGEPMRFGNENQFELQRKDWQLSVVDLSQGQGNANHALIHDPSNLVLAQQLAGFEYPQVPVALGVLYQTQRPCYETELNAQVGAVKTRNDLSSLLSQGHTWEI